MKMVTLTLTDEEMYDLLDVVLFTEDNLYDFYKRMVGCGRAKNTDESYSEWEDRVYKLDESILKLL